VQQLMVYMPEAGAALDVLDRVHEVGGGREAIEGREAAEKAAMGHRVLEDERPIICGKKTHYSQSGYLPRLISSDPRGSGWKTMLFPIGSNRPWAGLM
jgi:hypothetical protein